VIVQWLLLILFVGVGGANIIRGILGFAVSSSLSSQSIPLPLLSTVYFLYGVGFVVAGAAHLSRPGRSQKRLVLGVALSYQAVVWIIHLVGDRSSYARDLWLRDLVWTCVFILVVVGVTRGKTARPPARRH
jgi:hypothetical protein